MDNCMIVFLCTGVVGLKKKNHYCVDICTIHLKGRLEVICKMPKSAYLWKGGSICFFVAAVKGD